MRPAGRPFSVSCAALLEVGDAPHVETMRLMRLVGAKLRAVSLGRMQNGVFNGLSHQLKAEYVVELLHSLESITSVRAGIILHLIRC